MFFYTIFRQSTLLFTSPNLFTVIGSNMVLLVALLVVVSHITTSSVSIPQSIHLRLIVCLSIFTGEDQSCTCLSLTICHLSIFGILLCPGSFSHFTELVVVFLFFTFDLVSSRLSHSLSSSSGPPIFSMQILQPEI